MLLQSQAIRLEELSQREMDWNITKAIASALAEEDEGFAKATLTEEVRSFLLQSGVSEDCRIYICHSWFEVERYLPSPDRFLLSTSLLTWMAARPSTQVEVYSGSVNSIPVFCILIPLSWQHLRECLHNLCTLEDESSRMKPGFCPCCC